MEDTPGVVPTKNSCLLGSRNVWERSSGVFLLCVREHVDVQTAKFFIAIKEELLKVFVIVYFW